MSSEPPNHLRRAPAILLLAIGFGVLAGAFELANTAGTHVAAGRWILEHRSLPEADPFSFTADSRPWADRAWLFQLLVAAVDEAGSPAALVALRMLVVSSIAVLLLVLGVRGGLSPPAALILAALCLHGARFRLPLEPALLGLALVPIAVTLFLGRHRLRPTAWLGGIAATQILGANLGAGTEVVPILLTGLLVTETIKARREPSRCRSVFRSGAIGLSVAFAASSLTPFASTLAAEWLAQDVPSHVVDPTWLSMGATAALAPWVGAILALVLLVVRDHDPTRWTVFALTAALAVHRTADIGLLYVLLPLSVAPALARFETFSSRTPRRRLDSLLAAALVLVLGLSYLGSSRRPPGFGFGATAPSRACDFMDEHELPTGRLYNDAAFGGYLLYRYPSRRVFLDDRRDVNGRLQREIDTVLSQADVARWRRLLDDYGVATALVGYRPAISVRGADAGTAATRGFSALWFPTFDWSLVHWDDTAMLFVKRSTAPALFLSRFEYRVLRPDDLAHIASKVAAGEIPHARFTRELQRTLLEDPDCERALAFADLFPLFPRQERPGWRPSGP